MRLKEKTLARAVGEGNHDSVNENRHAMIRSRLTGEIKTSLITMRRGTSHINGGASARVCEGTLGTHSRPLNGNLRKQPVAKSTLVGEDQPDVIEL